MVIPSEARNLVVSVFSPLCHPQLDRGSSVFAFGSCSRAIPARGQGHALSRPLFSVVLANAAIQQFVIPRASEKSGLAHTARVKIDRWLRFFRLYYIWQDKLAIRALQNPHLVKQQIGRIVYTVKRNEFLQKLDQVKCWRRHGTRAPHKPLLVLLALGRAAQGQERLVRYEEDIERPLTDLLKCFGPPRKNFRPLDPFGRLRNDGLWEIPGGESLPVTVSGDLLRSGLIKHDTKGGFPQPIYNLLRSDSGLVQEAARKLLYEHFPYSLHDDILQAADFPAEFLMRDAPAPPYGLASQYTAVRKRDRDFPDDVLAEYGYRCAVCGFALRLEEKSLGLEAAHIKWHSAGGPDEVPNGLALCSIHHKALDRGALGLAPTAGGFKVRISDKVDGKSETTRWFWDCQGRPLRHPRRSTSSRKPNSCIGIPARSSASLCGTHETYGRIVAHRHRRGKADQWHCNSGCCLKPVSEFFVSLRLGSSSNKSTFVKRIEQVRGR